MLSWNLAYFSSTSASYCVKNYVFVWIFCHQKKTSKLGLQRCLCPHFGSFFDSPLCLKSTDPFCWVCVLEPVRNGRLPGWIFQFSQDKQTTETQKRTQKGKKSWSLIDHPQSISDLGAKVMSTHFNDEFILEPGRKTLHTGEGGLDYISHI